MNFCVKNFYIFWREHYCAFNVLRDSDSVPPEKLLQAVWLHQRLHRDLLKTADGKCLRVLHPGFASDEGGPDFRGAVLQFGDEKPVSGDVEIDLLTSGWHAHGHDKNPRFKNVILQVVWEESKKSKNVPINLSLKNILDAPLPELVLSLENESGLPARLRGKCSAPLRSLSEMQLTKLLQAASIARFQNKAAAMLARAKNSNWEQVLWENLFRALGYKNNLWPMQNLAETKSRWMRGISSVLELQARMLGVGGLLPDDLTCARKSSDTYLCRLWDFWWRDRDEFETCILTRNVWKFHGLRPANYPERRLALASHWLASGKLVSQIENWGMEDIITETVTLPHNRVNSPADSTVIVSRMIDSFNKIIQVGSDDFWSWHWTFKSARLIKPQTLLGDGRATDLAVNVILPWLWIRAKESGKVKFMREMEQRLLAWPAAADNAILKLARQRLLGTSRANNLKGAAQQQGLMQVTRDFCDHSNAVCMDCQFPELVRCLNSKTQG